MNCNRCHRHFDPYWQAHSHEDDLESIKKSGLCMKCAIETKVPQSWNPYQLGAQGRNDFKLRKQQEAKR